MNQAALQALRERSGYSIRALAEVSGVSKSTIAALEAGDRPASPATVKRLAEALAVPIPALLRNVEVA